MMMTVYWMIEMVPSKIDFIQGVVLCKKLSQSKSKTTFTIFQLNFVTCITTNKNKNELINEQSINQVNKTKQKNAYF